MQTPGQLLPHTECGLFNSMSKIKNAYVCIVNGEPELFETEEYAQDYAMCLSSMWHESGTGPAPKLAVMSVVQYLQAQVHLHQLAC